MESHLIRTEHRRSGRVGFDAQIKIIGAHLPVVGGDARPPEIDDGFDPGGEKHVAYRLHVGQLLDYTLSAAHDGTLTDTTANGTRTLVTFTGLESVNDSSTSANRSVQFAATGGSAVLAVDPSVAGQLKLDFGTDLSLSFKAPTNAITVNGAEGNDSLTVDFANGIPIPVGRLQFNGGGQANGGQDQLLLNNATAPSVDYMLTGAQAGTFAANSITFVSFTGLEAINDSLEF